jgi:hypothetical protein
MKMKTIHKVILFILLAMPLAGMAEIKEAMIGIFTTMMVSIFGFAFWDRKLSLAPVK